MNYFLYCILIFCSIIQVTPLYSKIGYIGNTPMPIIIVFSLFFITLKYKKIKISKINKILVGLLFYLVAINIGVLFYEIVIKSSNINVLGENALIKTIKGLLYFVFNVGYIVCLDNLLPTIDNNKIFKPVFFTFISLFIILIFEITLPGAFNNIFHLGHSYNRIRLITSESSYTGTLIGVYSLLSLFYLKNKSKIKKILIIIMTGIFVISSGSKGFIFTIILTAIIYIIFSKIKVKNKILVIGIISLMSLAILPKAIEMLNHDINQTTSVATRSYTTIVSLICMMKYPLGMGNFMYLTIYPREMLNNIWLMNSGTLNLSEIYAYINTESDVAVGAKSGIFQWALYWGIVGTILFGIYLFKLIQLSRTEDKYSILFFLVVFLIISIISYVSFEIKYEIWMAFSLINYLINNRKQDNVELENINN